MCTHDHIFTHIYILILQLVTSVTSQNHIKLITNKNTRMETNMGQKCSYIMFKTQNITTLPILRQDRNMNWDKLR